MVHTRKSSLVSSKSHLSDESIVKGNSAGVFVLGWPCRKEPSQMTASVVGGTKKPHSVFKEAN